MRLPQPAGSAAYRDQAPAAAQTKTAQNKTTQTVPQGKLVVTP